MVNRYFTYHQLSYFYCFQLDIAVINLTQSSTSIHLGEMRATKAICFFLFDDWPSSLCLLSRMMPY